MWKKLSFKTQLFLPLGLMFVVALIMGGVLLQVFATGQLAHESEPARRSAEAVAKALNAALRLSNDPQQTLDAFAQSLGTSSEIQFRPAGAGYLKPVAEARADVHGVPRWFVDLLAVPETDLAVPVLIGDRHVGDIALLTNLAADLFEKWAGFLAFICFVAVLTVLTWIIAHTIAGSAVGPLQALGEGLTRMRRGDYAHVIPVAGPPEIRQGCQEANALARALRHLSDDNHELLRRIVSLQDDERRDLARDLHDELGPLLFGIRANTVALIEAIPSGTESLGPTAESVLQSVEALQQANRRILDRLRPLYIQDLGLQRSIETLLQNFRKQAPQVSLTASIDPGLDRIDGLLSQTVYRLMQEALTNVLRHARASRAEVKAMLAEGEIIVEISDDGIGFAADNVFGRGLTGMHERVRALSGTLQLLREAGRTLVRCRLPMRGAQAAAARAS